MILNLLKTLAIQSLLLSVSLSVGIQGLAQTDLTDGPYLFEEENEWVAYSIANGNMERRPLPENRMANTFSIATDIEGKTFQVNLKPGFSYELSTYDMPDKLVAISDIEGNFSAFRELLQVTGVIDEALNWQFGEGHLVLTGDFFDRGSMVTEVLWLIYKLEWEAYEAGGHIHFILGNHEIMNLQGDLRYVAGKYEQSAKLMDKDLVDLYSLDTELGQWLRTKNIVERIGDHLFVHAGLSQKVNELNLSIAEINTMARPYYDRDAYLADAEVKTLMSGDGPFWYRGYYRGGKIASVIEKSLKQFGVSHIITGHTVVADTISTWHDGTVINIDTRHAEGKSEALVIEGGRHYRVDTAGERKPLFADR